MAQWWEALSTLQKVFYYFAIPATVLLLLQTVLTIIGFSGNSEFEAGGADADGNIDIDFNADVDADFNIEGDFEGEFGVDAEGIDSEGFDIEAEAMPGFKFFTIRGFIAFFCLMGWTGVTLSGGDMSVTLVIIISVAVGLAAMFLIGGLFYLITHLQASGNVRMRNALGKSGRVYIPIPPARKGSGKIQIKVQERLIEADAVTDSTSALKTGQEVTVVDLSDAGSLVVEKA